jgi:hypothetical protein
MGFFEGAILYLGVIIWGINIVTNAKKETKK